MNKHWLIPFAVAVLAAVLVGSGTAQTAAAATTTWKMTGVGGNADDMAKHIEATSGGTIQIAYHQPGELFPPLEMFEAIRDGRVDAGGAPVGFWSKEIPSAPLFSAVPFGPSAPEYLAWMLHGGGQELLDETLAPLGVRAVLCSVTPPEASGWFREEIASLEDLRGLKMRFFGLGALVMQKFGVETRLLPPSKIFAALESGEIDATEFSTPFADLNRGFYKVAKHYYFPGWHQPYTLVMLMVNERRWAELSDTQVAQVNAGCSRNLVATLAAEEASQFEALETLKGLGVQIHRWSPEMLRAFETAWNEVALEQSQADPGFRRAWESLNEFRSKHGVWRELAMAR